MHYNLRIATITNYHKLSGLKQQKFTHTSGGQRSKSQMFSGLYSFPEASEENHALAFFSFQADFTPLLVVLA